jgi:hypothetical protein
VDSPNLDSTSVNRSKFPSGRKESRKILLSNKCKILKASLLEFITYKQFSVFKRFDESFPNNSNEAFWRTLAKNSVDTFSLDSAFAESLLVSFWLLRELKILFSNKCKNLKTSFLGQILTNKFIVLKGFDEPFPNDSNDFPWENISEKPCGYFPTLTQLSPPASNATWSC